MAYDLDLFASLPSGAPMTLGELYDIIGRQIALGHGDAAINLSLPVALDELHPALHQVDWTLSGDIAYIDETALGDEPWILFRIVRQPVDLDPRGFSELPSASTADEGGLRAP